MQRKHVAAVASLLILFGLVLWLAPLSVAQPVQPGEDRTRLGVLLRQLNTVGTFMMATAHPDDEDNALLAMLAKGQGIRSVLVTATRGDGGQNEIGPELFDALAVLRTEELLAAHRLDGAEQYFTRAVDFGYSFSREETFKKWGREAILGDFVRMIRTVRPEVITALSPEGEGGGQHHQASAVLAHEAYRSAADPLRFPEQLGDGLRPWQPKKFYFSEGFPFQFRAIAPGSRRPSSTYDANVTIVELEGYDTLLGRTYAEIGRHARSMHKCQGMSPLIGQPWPSTARYRLAETTIPGQLSTNELSLFDGIDISIEGLIQFAGDQPPNDLTFGLVSVARHAQTALQAFEQEGALAASSSVLQGLVAVRNLREQLPSLPLTDDALWEIDFRLAAKERQFEEVAVLVHGLLLKVTANDGLVVSGQPVTISPFVANRGAVDVIVEHVRLAGFDQASVACGKDVLVAGGMYECSSELRIPESADPTNIHWNHVPGFARYVFDPQVPFGVPFRPTPFRATFELEFDGERVSIERPVEYRYSNDLFSGEKRTSLNVAPRFAVEITPTIAIIPISARKGQEVRVTITNISLEPGEGEVTLAVPAGWSVTPVNVTVRFSHENEEQIVRFTVSSDEAAVGEYTISASVRMAASIFGQGYQVVEYQHIGRRHLVHPAEATFKVIDVAIVSDLTVGYVDGVGDAVPAAIEQLGARVEFLDSDALTWGDLSYYEVIVTGVRAYERRPDLRANNDRLIDYVEAGGTLIVQYNKLEFNDAQYGPYPAEVGRERVTDETAPIRVLATDHQVFGWPNKIDGSTWDGWVQERGLYFLGNRDPAYADLVELVDSFESNPGPKRGALVEARAGKGRWIYVGLGLWRQLPAGTTGAYKLLANLLSLGQIEDP